MACIAENFEELKSGVIGLCETQVGECFEDGIKKQVGWYKKYFKLSGGYVEN